MDILIRHSISNPLVITPPNLTWNYYIAGKPTSKVQQIIQTNAQTLFPTHTRLTKQTGPQVNTHFSPNATQRARP